MSKTFQVRWHFGDILKHNGNQRYFKNLLKLRTLDVKGKKKFKASLLWRISDFRDLLSLSEILIFRVILPAELTS